jgi:carboxy-terminal domain RNA polymerase II polypeptide A small phosphatase
VKDLTCISKDLSRVVIVDNNPFSFLLQPLNGIPCVPFSPSQPSDDQVPMIILLICTEQLPVVVIASLSHS